MEKFCISEIIYKKGLYFLINGNPSTIRSMKLGKSSDL